MHVVKHRRRMGHRPPPNERGQLLPLVIGFGIIILLLCTVVFDAAQVFVYRRALHAIADGAALAATNGINKAAIYSSGVSDRVELSQQLAEDEVRRYVADGGYQSLTCAANVGATQVTVACNGTVELPIVNSISSGLGRVRVDVASTAETFAGP